MKMYQNFYFYLLNLPLSEISKLSDLKGEEINEAKKILAFEVTKIVRGLEKANEALEMSKNVFQSNIIDNRLVSINIEYSEIENNNFSILDAIEQLKLVKSRSEIKRLIKSNGIKVNNINYQENDFSLINYSNGSEIKISVGKKRLSY